MFRAFDAGAFAHKAELAFVPTVVQLGRRLEEPEELAADQVLPNDS